MTDTKTFEVDGSDVRDALTGVLLSAGKDTMLPALCAVHVSTDGNTLRFRTTDRYRLTEATMPHTGDGEPPVIDGFLVDAKDVKALVASLPKRSARGFPAPVTFELTDAGHLKVSHSFGAAQVELRALDGEFPRLDQIIGSFRTASEGDEGVTRIGFNPKYLADYTKIPRDRNAPVGMSLAGGKGLYDEWTFSGVKFTHVLMAVRLSS